MTEAEGTVPLLDRARLAPPEPMPAVVRLGDLIKDLEADAVMRNTARLTGAPFGPVTGIRSLDEEFGGAIPQGLHVVHGGPGVGKTALALQVGATCGCPCLYVSAEMSPLELLRRHTARVSGEFLGRFKSGEMPPQVAVRHALEAAAKAPHLHIVDATMAYAPEPWIRDLGRDARETANCPHLLVIVDSLHSWAESNPNQGTEYDVVSDGCRQLRTLAAQLRCAVVAIAERNRGGMQKGGMSSTKGSGKIEYGAETVLALDADESRISDETAITARFEKNRNGTKGATVDLLFYGAKQQYREAGR